MSVGFSMYISPTPTSLYTATKQRTYMVRQGCYKGMRASLSNDQHSSTPRFPWETKQCNGARHGLSFSQILSRS